MNYLNGHPQTIPNKPLADSNKTIVKQPATVHEPKNQSALDNSSSHFPISSVLIVLAILVTIAFFVWKPFDSNNSEVGLSQSISPDSLTEQVNEANKLTAEQLILSPSYISKDGQVVHFYKGAFYYENDIYPVMVGFIVSDGRIQRVIYKNVTYGGRIAMNYQSLGDDIRLSGKDGNNDFTMVLSAGEDNRLLGTAVDGNKSMMVRLMPNR